MPTEIQSFSAFNFDILRVNLVHIFDSGEFYISFTDVSRMRFENLCGFSWFWLEIRALLRFS